MNGQLTDADAELRARQTYARALGVFRGALEQYNDLLHGSNSSTRLDQIQTLRLDNPLLNQSIASGLIAIDNARGLLLVERNMLPGYDEIMANHSLAVVLQNAQMAESRRTHQARNFAELMDRVMFALNVAGLLGELSLAVRAGLLAARTSGTAASAMRGIEVELWRPPPRPLLPNLTNAEINAACEGATSEARLLTNEASRAGLLRELSRQGVRHWPENIVAIERIGGRVVFLETGNARAGLQHIVQRHGADFARRGIAEGQVPDALMTALRTNIVVGSQRGRPIFEFVFNGQTQRAAITVGDNGFIVGANPAAF